jgi:hypothetical protein
MSLPSFLNRSWIGFGVSWKGCFSSKLKVQSSKLLKMEEIVERGHLLTEQVNPNSQTLDQMSALEIVDLFNQEDAKTIAAIAAARVPLSEAIDRTAASLRQGGRLFYIGAGAGDFGWGSRCVTQKFRGARRPRRGRRDGNGRSPNQFS